MAYDFKMIAVSMDRGVASAVIDSPPINVMTPALFGELDRLSHEIEADPDVRVLVMRSANPDFFIAHFDVAAILERPIDQPPVPTRQRKPYHAMCERFRTSRVVTIALIEGRIGGGGSELAASFDMRFGVRGKTIVNQMEVALGILPGGTGTQRLPRLMNRARALEVILGCDDLDAETAEAWGYLNRALPADEIGPFVENLARRIASFPPQAVELAKMSVDSSAKDLEQGLSDEAFNFQVLMQTPEARKNMARFLEIGGQTREGERAMGDLCGRLGSGG
ncbi:MAG: enoyl-CoA hydratase/isomerase family protein [Pseudomonadota bacterium]